MLDQTPYTAQYKQTIARKHAQSQESQTSVNTSIVASLSDLSLIKPVRTTLSDQISTDKSYWPGFLRSPIEIRLQQYMAHKHVSRLPQTEYVVPTLSAL